MPNLLTQLKILLEKHLGEDQIGFRRCRSQYDRVFTQNQVIEQQQKFNKNTHIYFIDFKRRLIM